MQKFLVLFTAPVAVLEDWMKQEETFRKEEEAKMKRAWDVWMGEHKALFTGGVAGAGKTKQVTKDGVTDTKNAIMMYALIEAESHDVAATAFVEHPHFGIPQAAIEIMPLHFLPGFEE